MNLLHCSSYPWITRGELFLPSGAALVWVVLCPVCRVMCPVRFGLWIVDCGLLTVIARESFYLVVLSILLIYVLSPARLWNSSQSFFTVLGSLRLSRLALALFLSVSLFFVSLTCHLGTSFFSELGLFLCVSVFCVGGNQRVSHSQLRCFLLGVRRLCAHGRGRL